MSTNVTTSSDRLQWAEPNPEGGFIRRNNAIDFFTKPRIPIDLP
ncbi:hypothetical protein [Leptolyngbya ohadii]|nr:hypothetical protein [Leptolyngbya ohadii]